MFLSCGAAAVRVSAVSRSKGSGIKSIIEIFPYLFCGIFLRGRGGGRRRGRTCGRDGVAGAEIGMEVGQEAGGGWGEGSLKLAGKYVFFSYIHTVGLLGAGDGLRWRSVGASELLRREYVFLTLIYIWRRPRESLK